MHCVSLSPFTKPFHQRERHSAPKLELESLPRRVRGISPLCRHKAGYFRILPQYFVGATPDTKLTDAGNRVGPLARSINLCYLH